jgi:hypothetical protein
MLLSAFERRTVGPGVPRSLEELIVKYNSSKLEGTPYTMYLCVALSKSQQNEAKRVVFWISYYKYVQKATFLYTR